MSGADRTTAVQRPVSRGAAALLAAAALAGWPGSGAAQGADILVVGGEGRHCGEDTGCINRLHPDIPMAATARPGQTIVLRTRNASDFAVDPDSGVTVQLVDTPNVGLTALLPLDIFVGERAP